ncbi:MAG: His-Xaa-Ser system radical SAM maturase HxsB [Candidatus Omnitrophota bacterium]
MDRRNLALIPFTRCVIKDKYLVSNFLGGWDFLDKEEFSALNSFKLKTNTPFSNRLYERGLLADENNLSQLIEKYKALNGNLFHDTSLHIAVVTTNCNLACKYCQAKANKADMGIEVAEHVLKCLFEVKNPCVTLELQGGEPLANWQTTKFLIENSRKINDGHKNLKIALVTNLTLMDDEKAKFLIGHDVEICVSLDGPKRLHNRNRIFSKNNGTYDKVSANIERLREKFNKKVNLLPTITKSSLGHYKEIIDEYIKRGQSDIALRPVNKLGNACSNWGDLGYSADEFTNFYKKAMDYILALNKKGVFIRERIANVILQKILCSKDTGYTEMMNPCGAGRSQIVYMPNGECFPCDEARMLGGEVFLLGNILEKNYDQLMGSENLLHLLQTSLVNLWDANSAFSPWLGTCPVLNYSAQGNFIPKIHCSSMHKIYNFQFRYIFEKILENKENFNIFKSWVKK